MKLNSITKKINIFCWKNKSRTKVDPQLIRTKFSVYQQAYLPPPTPHFHLNFRCFSEISVTTANASRRKQKSPKLADCAPKLALIESRIRTDLFPFRWKPRVVNNFFACRTANSLPSFSRQNNGTLISFLFFSFSFFATSSTSFRIARR